MEADAANKEKHPPTKRSSTFKAGDINGVWLRWNRWCGLAFVAIDRNVSTVFASFYSVKYLLVMTDWSSNAYHLGKPFLHHGRIYGIKMIWNYLNEKFIKIYNKWNLSMLSHILIL